MASDEFRRLAQVTGADFSRNRALPLTRLVPLLINFRKGTLQDEVDQFFETMDDKRSYPAVSASAFCQARKKFKPSALVALNDLLLQQIAQHLAPRRWHGFRVLAVDGSTGRLPPTDEIDAFYGGQAGNSVPVARFSRLYDVLNDWVIQADMAPYKVQERELAAYYLLELEADDLVLYDRGYPAFWLFALHHQEQRHYCARVRDDFNSEVKAFVDSGEKTRTVNLVPNRLSARQCEKYHLPIDPLPVRLVRVELKTGEVEVLATSLLDETEYPTHWFGRLYQMRWGIEENYKREKKRLEIENFSGLSPVVIQQDFHAKIFAQNLTALFVTLAQWLANERYRRRKYAYRINFANALSKMKNSVVRLFLNAVPPELSRRLLERMALCVEPLRPDRSYPRNMRRVRVPGFQGNYKRSR